MELVKEEEMMKKKRTIELGLFVDSQARRNILKAGDPDATDEEADEDAVVEDVLATVNQANAIFMHPSLEGGGVALGIVRLEVMRRQPKRLKHVDGERIKTLSHFCG